MEYSEKLKILLQNAQLREKIGQDNLQAVKNYGMEVVTSRMRNIYDAESAVVG